jgi:hypothetical protein
VLPRAPLIFARLFVLVVTLGATACEETEGCPPGATGSIFCRGDAGPIVPIDAAACVDGAPCDPGIECHLGQLECSPVPRCIDMGQAPEGHECDTGMACDAAGSCSVCAAGATCDTGNPCSVGTIDCNSGSPVCVPQDVVPPGTPCGSAGTCGGSGMCSECIPDSTCDTGNPCMVGTVDCTGGVTTCVPSAARCRWA